MAWSSSLFLKVGSVLEDLFMKVCSVLLLDGSLIGMGMGRGGKLGKRLGGCRKYGLSFLRNRLILVA